MGAVAGVEDGGIYVKSWVNHLLLIGMEAPEIPLTPIQELLCNRETGRPVDLPWLPLSLRCPHYKELRPGWRAPCLGRRIAIFGGGIPLGYCIHFVNGGGAFYI
jgi:hypothetical protein